jgi:hypothetical protein
MIDWDHTDRSWKKYDRMTAAELMKSMGCSERVYKARLIFIPPSKAHLSHALYADCEPLLY